MAAKSLFEKAASQYGNFRKSNNSLTLCPNNYRFFFQDTGDRITCTNTYTGDSFLEVDEDTDAGKICRFISRQLESINPGLPPARMLGGNGKDFETLLMEEAGRLSKQGVLTMSRYGTMSTMVEGEWRPVPSLPDFEGVVHGGSQFIIEAKVCSQNKLRFQKQFIKHKQVQHMLDRSDFEVPCFVLIHFNERLGATFYEPPFTVAVPVERERMGGWKGWEAYAGLSAAEKKANKEGEPLTRELALKIGTRVEWHLPKRCTKPRPSLSFVPLADGS